MKIFYYSLCCAMLAIVGLEAAENPTVEVSASVSPSAVCVGTEVTFSASGTPDGGTYAWSGDVSGSSDSVTSSFSSEGSYEGTVSYTVTDDNGNEYSDETSVSVDVNTVDVSISGDTAPCVGADVTYTADVCPSPDGSETWSWSTSDGDSSTTDSLDVYVYKEDEFTVDVTYTYNGESATDSITVTPTVPSITVSDPSDAYPDDTVTWSASVTCLAAEDLVWSGDDGLSDSGSSSTDHSYAEVGTYTATATYDSESETYSDSGTVEIIPNCPSPSGSRTFGAITASWSGTLSGSPIDNSDFCSFTTSDADLSFTTGSPYSVSVDVSGAQVDWEENQDGDVQNVSISWSESAQDVGDLGFLTCQVSEVDATDSSGTVTFTVNLTESPQLLGGITLKDTVSGDITYDFSNSSYDFSGVSNVELELNVGDGDDLIATTTSASLDADGNVTVDFAAESNATFELEDLTMTVNSAGINVTFTNNSSGDPITVNSGDVDFDVDFTEIESLDAGVVNFTADVSGETVTLTGTVDSEDPIEGFGADISGSLQVETNMTTFEFTKITGTDISLNHADLQGEDPNGNTISGISFEVEPGAITKFEVASVVVVHADTKVRFSLENSSYESGGSGGSGEIKFDSAKLDFTENTSLEVNNFSMKANGDIDIGGLDVSIDKDPVYISGTANWESGYSLETTGEIGDDVSFDAELLFQSNDDFNVFYIAMSVSSTGIPIAQTGLELDGLGGRFGYNYRIFFSNGGVDGEVDEGNLAFGASIEVSDVLDFASLETEALLNLGGSTQTIEFGGQVSIPDSNDTYADFELTASYEFWEQTVSGTVSTSVTIPKGDGSLVQMDSGEIEYAILGGLNKWKLDADDQMTGSIFNSLTFEAEILANGSLDDASDFYGWIDGSLEYNKTQRFTYGNFDITDCGWNKFGVDGTIALNLTGNLDNVQFSDSSFSGTIGASLSTSLDGAVQWPTFWGNNCTVEFEASIYGALEISRSGGSTSASGELTVETDNKTKSIDYTFNNI